MKIHMRVAEGPDVGQEFTFPAEGESESEATNILVGRRDVSSKAHWQLSAKDRYVSRAHFLLEVRPPNCHLQDNMSMNGTFLRRAEGEEKRVENEVLQDGDCLRVGETILAFEIESERPVETQYHEGPALTAPFPAPAEEEKERIDLICVRCGEPLDQIPSLVGSLQEIDFMCDRCEKEVRAERRQAEKEQALVRFSCINCDADVTDRANADGRAIELKGKALYLCENCLQEEMEANVHRRGGLPEGDYGGFMLLRSLGKGGMGEVFKGWHKDSGRLAAIKQMLPIAQSDEKLLRRFHREISLMQGMDHPNLVKMYAAGQEGENPYFISEFVPGGDLAQLIDKDGNPTAPQEEVCRIIADALAGLAHFHKGRPRQKKENIHRDLKPENVLLSRENGAVVPKITDFGLAKSYEKYGGTITKTGEFAGTWMYMPPDQIMNFKYCTTAVDIFSMGVTLYYLLSGRSPWAGFPPPWQILKKKGRIQLKKTPAQMILHDPIVPLEEQRSGLPRQVYTVVGKAVRKKPEERYTSADDFRAALLRAVE